MVKFCPWRFAEDIGEIFQKVQRTYRGTFCLACNPTVFILFFVLLVSWYRNLPFEYLSMSRRLPHRNNVIENFNLWQLRENGYVLKRKEMFSKVCEPQRTLSRIWLARSLVNKTINSVCDLKQLKNYETTSPASQTWHKSCFSNFQYTDKPLKRLRQ